DSGFSFFFTTTVSYFCRDASGNGIVGGIFDHNRIGPNSTSCPDDYRAQNLCSCAYNDFIFQRWLTFFLFQVLTTQRDSLKQHTVIDDFGRLTNNHTHTVIDKEPTADVSPRVDFNTGKGPVQLRK